MLFSFFSFPHRDCRFSSLETNSHTGLQQKSPDQAGTGLMRIWCKAVTFQCMSVRSASYLSAGTAFSSPSSCIGLVRSDGSAFYSKTAPQYKVHCSFPASKPASQPVLLLWDFTRCLITILIFPPHLLS